MGEVNVVLRRPGKREPDDLVERDPHRKLDKHGKKAAEGIDLAFLIQPHRLLVAALGVFVLLLDLLDLRLELRHGAGGVELAHGQGEGERTDDYGECEDRQAEIPEQEVIERNERVRHRIDEEVVPEEADHPVRLLGFRPKLRQ